MDSIKTVTISVWRPWLCITCGNRCNSKFRNTSWKKSSSELQELTQRLYAL